MTSSLVGSEMCIRDSLQSMKVSVAGSYGTQVAGTPTKVRVEQPSETPVSYTHLTLPTICSV
eukprot:12329423-Prorocentrum_lima.AAC.1